MKRSFHVVYIITKLELGGAQKVCLSLLNGLKEAGTPVSLISGADGILIDELQSSDVILLDGLKREVRVSYLLLEIKNFIALIKHLKELKKKHKNIIVHTHSTKAGLIGRWAAWFARIPIRVHTIHGFAFHNHQPKLIWFAIYLLELISSCITTHFVCVSSQDVKTGIKLFPHFAYKHSIIRAAVNWQDFVNPAHTNSFPQNKPFVFGTISCFKKQKNLFDMLKSFESAYHHNNNIRLELIGDGSLRPNIEQWIAEHNLTHAITLHGWQKKVVPIMVNWHAFVLSSLWEGLPCAIIEARLLKLPVLSYNTGGIHDVISTGDNGMLYTQGDWQSLAQGMLTLSQQPELHNKLQSHPDSLHDFHNDQMIRQHMCLYQALRDVHP